MPEGDYFGGELSTDDDVCAGCGKGGMINTGLRTIAVSRWEPDQMGNVLVAVLCSDGCLATWARRRIRH